MSKLAVYWPYSYNVFLILFLFLVLFIGLVFTGAVGFALRQIGFSPQTTATIMIATFLGSYVNIPLLKIKTVTPIIREEYIRFFGMVFRVPQFRYREATTLIAINMGGALIPTFISVYLLYKLPSVMIHALTGISIVAFVSHAIAKPVKGLGIAVPAFVPPLIAALTAYIICPGSPTVVAYVSGVLGILIGADIANLHRVSELGARIVSIGGAGSFDGIFLSGILAVLLI